METRVTESDELEVGKGGLSRRPIVLAPDLVHVPSQCREAVPAFASVAY